jgi:hypothetical protein
MATVRRIMSRRGDEVLDALSAVENIVAMCDLLK